MRRVAITGMGCITSIGKDVASFTESLFAGHSGIGEFTDVPPGELRFTRTAAVRDFHPDDWLTAAQRQIAERSAQFAIASARQALVQSGIASAYDSDSIAAVIGCSTGGRTAEEEETKKLYTRGGRAHPLTVPRSMTSAGTSLICMEHHITGPAYTVSTACASGAHAIGQAFHMVRSGMVEAAVTGAHEAPLTYAFLKGWDSLRVVSPTSCRPFAVDRDGVTLGEGAAMVALEPFDTALARGAEILGEIVGFGMSSDAFHITQADPAGPAAAMNRALRDANVTSDQIGYVNAHGTATEVNDRVEAEALHRVFGERARALPVSSTKGMHGHAMGASGAIELIATILALRMQNLPANVGAAEIDPALQLGGLLLQNRKTAVSLALTNSFAFGGLNAVLALKGGPESRSPLSAAG